MDALSPEQAALQVRVYWEAEYAFYHKIITEEVERLRFNQGFEPVSVELYPTGRRVPAFVGTTRIGRRLFRARASERFDASGKTVLKVEIFPEPEQLQ